jgi:hypothetical protein
MEALIKIIMVAAARSQILFDFLLFNPESILLHAEAGGDFL